MLLPSAKNLVLSKKKLEERKNKSGFFEAFGDLKFEES